MAFSFQLLPCSFHFSSSILRPTQDAASKSQKPQILTRLSVSHFHLKGSAFQRLSSAGAAINGDGAVEPPKPARRGRKKGTTSSSSTSETESKPKKTRPSKKTQADDGEIKDKPAGGIAAEAELTEPDFENYDDGIDEYLDPPLVCCFGPVQKDFVPTVRVFEYPQHPDMYSQWKMLQWDPPEFARAPGGAPSNVAISHVRLGGRAAVIGKVGEDELGLELVKLMNKEHVQTRGVKIDPDFKTACTEMRVKFEDGKMKMETVKQAAEDALLTSELNLAILKEARMFHFCSAVLTSTVMESSLYKAIDFFKKSGGLVFFDVNLPLPLWKSRDETRKMMKKAWNESNIIEVSREEVEFLLDEDYYKFRKNYKHQYHAENYVRSKKWRDYYHYTRDEISPLWHDGLKFLFVTDGTLRIQYYTPTLEGEIVGTEDVLVTPMTCDRTGSGDAMVAAIIRKLITHPEMFDDQDVLERQLRFVVAAGIIAQWTIGSTRGLPTESASQNLKEQVYVPSMW